MQKIKTNELEKVKGGQISFLAAVGISALVVFVSGIIEGITSPRKCDN